jgi:hypothetical protein
MKQEATKKKFQKSAINMINIPHTQIHKGKEKQKRYTH